MSDYSQRLDALFQLEFFGMKLGLDNIRALLDVLGHPERKFPSIHIAGTNGKGSVAAILAAIQTFSGKRTALYTSPHLLDFRERIRIDGAMISEAEVAAFLVRIWPMVEERRATFFEVTTAMAFDHFARHNVDIAIVETGLGGRLDATNVLERPLATVITSIGYDHMAQLGSTLEAIAQEKAGIFKYGSPAVVNCSFPLEPVFKRQSEKMLMPVTFVQRQKEFLGKNTIRTPFLGAHQEDNLRTVLTTLACLPRSPGRSKLQQALGQTVALTGLRGRLEEVFSPEFQSRKLRLFLDVGHNEDALLRVAAFFQEQQIRPIIVFGIMRDKEVRRALEILQTFAKQIIAVQASTQRALSSSELHFLACDAEINSIDAGSVKDGIEFAFNTAIPGDTILVAGSHYVCGEFLHIGY